MSLSGFFPEQFDALADFMAAGEEVVRRVLIDQEMRPLLRKALVRLDERPDFPHILIGHDAPFADGVAYFAGLLDLLEGEIERNAAILAEAGVACPAPADGGHAPRRFLSLARRVAAALPEDVGALVFVLEPERIDDPATFRRAVGWLADTVSPGEWLKLVVVEDRRAPLLDEVVAANPRVGSQCFWLSPEEIERRLGQELAAAGPAPSPAKRQAMGLAAGMAFGKGDHTRAEALQQALVAEAEADGTPVEVATGLYNLGNTLVAREELDGAVEIFARACDLCIEHRLNDLSPLAFTNLGIALYRTGAVEDGFRSLKVARDHFRALGNRPGEAHVYDCLAHAHLDQGRRDEAERAWRFALKLYDGITAAALRDACEGGRRDIAAKLERLAAGQADAGDGA